MLKIDIKKPKLNSLSVDIEKHLLKEGFEFSSGSFLMSFDGNEIEIFVDLIVCNDIVFASYHDSCEFIEKYNELVDFLGSKAEEKEYPVLSENETLILIELINKEIGLIEFSSEIEFTENPEKNYQLIMRRCDQLGLLNAKVFVTSNTMLNLAKK